MNNSIQTQSVSPQGDDTVTKKLLKRAQRGDKEALGELMEKYRPMVCTMIKRIVKDSDTADDIFQQTCLNAIKNITKFDGKNKFITWFCCIALNAARNHLRSLKKFPLVNVEDVKEELLIDNRTNISFERFLVELQDVLNDAIANLPEIHRLPLILFHGDQLTYEEIAIVLGIPLGTVKSRTARGHKQVRHYIREHSPHLLTLFGVQGNKKS